MLIFGAGLITVNFGQHLMTKKVNRSMPEDARFWALNRPGESIRLWKTHKKLFPGDKSPTRIVIAGIALLTFSVLMAFVSESQH
jgi:hypothetical protein